MSDDTVSAGGDGSPQLDAKSGTQVPEPRELCDHICMLPADHVEHGMLHQYGYEVPSPRALVRRLQQETKELRDALDGMQKRSDFLERDRDKARGRVEELTEALRARPNVTESKLLLIGFNALYEAHRLVNFDTAGDVKLQSQLMESVELSRQVAEKWRALLARVDPEKEN